jgi:uncharacterized membrane protein YhhN
MNIALFVCTMLFLIYYDYSGGLWLKGLTSLWFVILGGVNLLYAHIQGIKPPLFLIFLELGLCCGMLADILLGIQFFIGLVVFALGHVLYIVAFYTLEKFRLIDLFIMVPISALSICIIVGTPYIQVNDPLMKKMLLGYAVVISCMLGKAVSNAILRPTFSRVLMLLGSVLFLFSDLMLAIDFFGKTSRLVWALCAYTYWPAQCILALSLFYFVNEIALDNKKKDI